MTADARRRAIEARLARLQKGSPGARQRLSEANAQFEDWWGICRKCGKKVEGSLAAIAEHRCG